jgi:hypothetical protein
MFNWSVFVQKLRRVIFFFPFQLIWVHLKKNHLITIVWIFFFSVVLQKLLIKYGIPGLLLYPEYMDNVGFMSHFILGFSCGGFIMAFNISSYIANGFRFPFIATLSKPFIKYCYNNFIIPLVFVIIYSYKMATYQYYNEFETIQDIILHLLSFGIGILFFLVISSYYFVSTNKDVYKLFGKDISEAQKIIPVQGLLHKKEKWYNLFNPDREWIVETYLSDTFKISLARDSKHYDKNMLKSVFSQNHLNASIFEVIVILSIIAIGVFREYSVMKIPSGASIFLLFTIILMVFSALRSWLKGWATTSFILLFVFINYLSSKDFFNFTNYAYGMDYSNEKPAYVNATVDSIHNNKILSLQDYYHQLEILNNWRKKNYDYENEKLNIKPKLIIINTSGGGLRSALWTYHSLQYADSVAKGKLLNQTHLISGSSGGMVGAAYLREIYLQSKTDTSININHKKHIKNVSKDLLNPLAFTLVVNDLFFKLQKFELGGHRYTKDRGYAFEKQLNINTENAFNKSLSAYRTPEYESKIPMMIFTPTIINDGRRLLISAQPISFMTNISPKGNVKNKSLTDGIEFSRFFKNQDADSVAFTSVLRASATFPYIMPTVSLPSEPIMNVMDAGVRDNTGLLTGMKFLFTFRNWINTNTSGVIIIQIRDKSKNMKMEEINNNTILQSISSPLGSVYGNFENIQNFDQDALILYSSQWFEGKIDVINFDMDNSNKDYISLSWHLTQKEKNMIMYSIELDHNQKAIEKLKQLLN